MNRGVKAALLLSSATLVSCTTSTTTSSVKVRPIADPAATAYGAGDALSVARGQFMLGNVGLALEGFRKAQRYNPSDPAALEGIGDCYASMGRLDIAQSSYESALALAPHDPRLLLALADVLDHEGQADRATETRAEARSYSQPALAQAAAASTPQASIPVASIGTVTVKLPPARPSSPMTPHHVALADAAITVSATPSVVTPSVPSPAAEGTITVALPPARAAGKLATLPAAPLDAEIALPEAPPAEVPAVVLPAVMPLSLPGAGVRLELNPLTVAEAPIDLPPQPEGPSEPTVREAVAPAPPQVDPRAAALAQRLIDVSNAVASNTPVIRPPSRPAPAPLQQPSAPDTLAVAASSGPRLERLTSGEVALLTTDKPIWQAPKSVQAASESSVRWVALAGAPARPNVQILNAARSRGLAASARAVLSNRGWRKIAIGDAPTTQHASVVLFSKSQAALGRRLAAQFGVAARMIKRNAVVLILGRDAVDRIGGPHRS